ncbi:MAG: ATP-binding cassette domain-containing protein [Candidatus Marinimicrobia bacterium]|nr:ATP-binding cassette domain-containing protein [Candidatus Neomarinimicrobiota bacterium]
MMEKNKLFSIRNFTQSYGGKTVLNIPKLDIYKDEFVVFLGKSGCGKTTLLETLSLMRRSHQDEFESSQIIFHPDTKKKQSYEYRELWKDEESLAHIRSDYFSFMFQESVFFDELNAGKNLILPKLIQQNENLSSHKESEYKKDIYKNIEQQVELLNMSKSKLDEKTNIQSGGQNQRFAFIRASLPEYLVMFADEPTGNLDELNANQIFQWMVDAIKKSGRSNSALVVTHQKELAVKYADRIVCISENGIIEDENIFVSDIINGKKIWKNETNNSQDWVLDDAGSNKDFLNVLENTITHKLETPKPQKEFEKDESFITERKNNYQPTFIDFMKKHKSKDFKIRFNNLYFFVLLIFLTIGLLAIGVSKHSLNELEKKMKDPYINWLSLTPLRQLSYEIYTIEYELSSSEVKEKFNLQESFALTRFGLNFLNRHDFGKEELTFGEIVTVEKEDIENSILDKISEHLDGKMFTRNNEMGLIVTYDLLKRNDYKKDAEFIFIREGDRKIPIPILGVADALPHKNTFICSQGFHWAIMQRELVYANKKEIFVNANKTETEKFKENLKNEIKKNGFKPFSIRINSYDTDTSRHDQHIVKIGYVSSMSEWNEFVMVSFDSMIAVVSAKTDDIDAFRYYPLQERDTEKIDNSFKRTFYNGISTQLKNLDKIVEFRKYLLETFGYELSLESIKNLENYNSVASLTNLLGISIIIIILFFLAIYVVYILYVHLHKMRKLLGLLLAFGASKNSIKIIYQKIIFGFILKTLFVALLISFLFLQVVFNYNFELELFIEYFNLMQLILILGVIGVSIVSAKYILLKFLKYEPGDLIYDRLEE